MLTVIVSVVKTIYDNYKAYEQSQNIEKLHHYIEKLKVEHQKMVAESQSFILQELISQECEYLRDTIETSHSNLKDVALIGDENLSEEQIDYLDSELSALRILLDNALHNADTVLREAIELQYHLKNVESLFVCIVALAIEVYTNLAVVTVRHEKLDNLGIHREQRLRAMAMTLGYGSMALGALRSRSDSRFKLTSRAIGEPIPVKPGESGPARMLHYGYTFEGRWYYDNDIGHPRRDNSRIIANVRKKMAKHQNKEFDKFTGVAEIREMMGVLDSAVTGDRTSVGLQAGITTNSVTNAWESISFGQGFDSPPLVLAAIESFHGTDTAGVRIKDLAKNGFSVMIEEEQSTDRETGHVSEVVGFLGIEKGNLYDDAGNLIGETGALETYQANGPQWHTVNLQNNYGNPVIIMQLMTYNGGQPAHTRIRNVGSNAFEFQIEEWKYLDKYHVAEEIGYIVMEGRRHRMDDGTTIEAGKIEADHQWAASRFDSAFTYAPVVLTHCQTLNGGDPVVTRHRNISASGFEVRLQEEEASDVFHYKETVGYVAIAYQ